MYHLTQGLITLIFGIFFQNKFYTIIVREKPSICYSLDLMLVQITWYSFLYNMFWATEPLEIFKRPYQSLSSLTACEVNQAFRISHTSKCCNYSSSKNICYKFNDRKGYFYHFVLSCCSFWLNG